MKGDFIVAEEVDTKDLKVGDVISFLATEEDTVIVKTHRIISIDDSTNDVSFITRGDNNEVNDSVPVFPSDVVGKWNNIRLSKVGTILDFVGS